ncbi:Lrp/AsnC family transcriptional regulator [Aquitalea palustris]|uniref:siroheme decarboxylase n=1 Tax=Aquitalea palustris TaxID=2480983 RepID=A0A454JMU0_9NEIS|nr:Lrp/AsnC family transcriptional regulator [Aquitalea palustris]RMD01504.1 Lrp/AsnC family transcriptional regulator [Aquitalea palustris]
MAITHSQARLNPLETSIVNQLQGGFPLDSNPFARAAAALGCSERALLQGLDGLLQRQVLTRFGPLYQIERMGGCFVLAALAVPPARFDEVAAAVNSLPAVAHNYQRSHKLNMWFVLAAASQAGISAACSAIELLTDLTVHVFPKQREYFVGMRFTVGGQGAVGQLSAGCAKKGDSHTPPLDEDDWRLIRATQAGLPLVAQPYRQLADSLQLPEDMVLARLGSMLEQGVIRRIGAVPNHYAIGYRANGMAVFDVADELVDELGQQLGQLDCVSHCYRRPRHLPHWPYNLFAMVHGGSRRAVREQQGQLLQLLGPACRRHALLFSTRILKKSGLRV